MKAEKFEFQSAFAGLFFAFVESENRKRNFSSKMSSLCLSISNKMLQHHAFFQYFFFPLPPQSAHLAAQCFKFSKEVKIATMCFNLQLNGQESLSDDV